jgi:hypothetical protein
VVALGVALLSTAVVLSTSYARARDHLDWSTYLVGLLATASLLGVAAAVRVRAPDADRATDLVAWPGAFGIVGLGLMIGVGLDGADATVYVAGLAVLISSVGALLLTGRGPFVVPAVLGAFATYGQAIEDVLTGKEFGEELPGIKIALALALFAVLATAACWTRVESRVLGGAVVGGLTVAAFAGVTGVLAINQVLLAPPLEFHSIGVGTDGDFADYAGPTYDGATDDAWTILVLAVLLMLGWAACAALTGHVVYRILVVAMAVSVIPLVTQVLTVEHPTWWAVAATAIGGLALVSVGLGAASRPRPAP